MHLSTVDCLHCWSRWRCSTTAIFDGDKAERHTTIFPEAAVDGVLSVCAKKRKSCRDDEDAENDASKSSKTEQGGRQSKPKTEAAVAHVAACGSLFQQIECPWKRTVRFTDSDFVMEERLATSKPSVKPRKVPRECPPRFGMLQRSKWKMLRANGHSN